MKLTEYIKKQQHRKRIEKSKGGVTKLKPSELKGKRFREWFDAGMP